MWRAWRDDEFVIDPSRVTIEITRTGVDGDTFKHTHLMDQYGIQVNKTSRNTVLFMTNIGTSRSAIAYLIEVLVKLAERFERDRATRGLPEARTDDDVMPPLPDFSAFAPAYAHPSGLPDGDLRGAFYDGQRRGLIEYATPEELRERVARGATGLGGLRDAVPSRLPGARAGADRHGGGARLHGRARHPGDPRLRRCPRLPPDPLRPDGRAPVAAALSGAASVRLWHRHKRVGPVARMPWGKSTAAFAPRCDRSTMKASPKPHERILMVDAALRTNAANSADNSSDDTTTRIDVDAVGDLLLGTWADTRREAREMIKDPAFWRDDSLGKDEHRERVLSQMHLLVQNKAVHRAFPKRLGGEENNGGNIAGFEELVSADPSLQIKSGVQWGLFGSAVLQLGTAEHHDRWLPGIMSLEIPGAFAMTEIGHGSDVASIGTTATYDPETEEFVINTPFRAATKEYLGNAALHGIAATVFAQLITNGVNHGVHCFYVPLRGEDGVDLPGIGREDDGLKGGLNGIDNGRLSFDHVRSRAPTC
jgi:hypothetical protein